MALRHLSLYTCCKPYKTTFYLKAKSGEKNKLQKRVNYFRKFFLKKSLLSPYLPPSHYTQQPSPPIASTPPLSTLKSNNKFSDKNNLHNKTQNQMAHHHSPLASLA